MLLFLCAAWFFPTLGMAEEHSLQRIRDKLTTGKEPIRIVCLGDSATAVQYRIGGRRAWPDMLKIALNRIFPTAKFEVVNSGTNGDTTGAGLRKFDNDVLAHHPDIVIVFFGANDIVFTPIEEFQKNLVEMVTVARKNGAEVVLCSHNNMDDATAERGRSNKKLADYVAVIQKVGRENDVPVGNCFEAFTALRAHDIRSWKTLFTDTIHLNMDGQKRIAEEIAAAISGKPVSLDDVGPPTPAMPTIFQLLSAGKRVKMAAMPPYDTLMPMALRKLFPDAQIEASTWPTESKSIADLLTMAKNFRDQQCNLIVVAVPASVTCENSDQFRQLFLEMMHELRSAGFKKWDVVAFAPSLESAELSGAAFDRDQLLRQLIRSGDIATLFRMPGDRTAATALLETWLRDQTTATN